jgi:hypothetical protein
MFKNSWMNYLALTLTLATLAGCGKDGKPIQNIVTAVQLKTDQKNGEDWINTTVNLTTGGFTLSAIQLPIYDPTHPGIQYGQISIRSTLCSNCPAGNQAELGLGLNLTQITKIQGIDPLLPNGAPIPVGGLQNSHVITLPVADTGARIYFAFGPKVGMLGTAVPFKELDPAGQSVPNLNLFPAFNIGPVQLMAGFFAGAATKTTGVGVFIDLATVISQSPLLTAITRDYSSVGSTMGPRFSSKLVMKSVIPPRDKIIQFYKGLNKAQQQTPVLKLR